LNKPPLRESLVGCCRHIACSSPYVTTSLTLRPRSRSCRPNGCAGRKGCAFPVFAHTCSSARSSSWSNHHDSVRQRFLDDLRPRKLLTPNHSGYVAGGRRLAKHFGRRPINSARRSPHLPTPSDFSGCFPGACSIRACVPGSCSMADPGSPSGAVRALRQTPKRLPVVLAPKRWSTVRRRPTGVERVLLQTDYALACASASLIRLRSKTWIAADVVHVHAGKGRKDRLGLVAEAAGGVRAYWRVYRPTFWLFPGRSRTRPAAPQCAALDPSRGPAGPG